MERLGSAKWLEIFERLCNLKKVEKHCYNLVKVVCFYASADYCYCPNCLKNIICFKNDESNIIVSLPLRLILGAKFAIFNDNNLPNQRRLNFRWEARIQEEPMVDREPKTVGVYFINIVQAVFMCADPESAKRHLSCQSFSDFRICSAPIKAFR
jgi:hypothetical protein